MQRIIKMGNPLLRKKSSVVPVKDIKSDEIQSTIRTMWETLRHTDNGIGIHFF